MKDERVEGGISLVERTEEENMEALEERSNSLGEESGLELSLGEQGSLALSLEELRHIRTALTRAHLEVVFKLIPLYYCNWVTSF